MKNIALVLVGSVLVATISCSPDGSAPATKSDFTRVTPNLEVVESTGIEKIHTVGGIFLSSQPDEAGFKQAKDGGIKTVIDLRHTDEVEFNEEEVVESLGLTYVHLPWNGAEELTDDVFDKVREVLKSAEKPVLLHCKSANRVGAVWLPHRVLDQGIDMDAALEEAKTVGLKKPEYEEKAMDYITRKSS